MEKLELRMFGLVPYNISPIQQAIQYGHSVVEYGLKNFHSNDYLDWAKYYKTFIILNGGTTNNNPEKLGTLNQHLQTLKENKILLETFHEPDLGDQLTSIVFLVDERVFNRKKYLDFSDWLMDNYSDLLIDNFKSPNKLAKDILNSKNQKDINIYNEWVDYIGGEKNVFLRSFLKDFKLA